jgi:predicted histone-like DNA-binding protein
MSIPYVKVKRNILFGDNPGERYIARIVREQFVDLDLIAEQIAGASTMSKADVMGVLQQLQVEMSYHLLRGASVRLGILGTFTPNLRAKSQAEAEKVKADTIKGLYIAFRPGPWFNYQIKNVKFHYVDTTIKNIVAYSSSSGEETTTTEEEINQMNALLEQRKLADSPENDEE